MTKLFKILIIYSVILETMTLFAMWPINYSISDIWNNLRNRNESLLSTNNTNVMEDASLLTSDLILKYGYPSEIHKVITDDGYILTLHRIPSKNKTKTIGTVLLMHGVLDTSATWLLMGPNFGFGYILSDLGYDVWMGNVRGNRYSKNHISLNSNMKKFWDFSFHEIGKYDLPAMIDYIIMETGVQKIHYIGHSQGTTIFWIMCSEHPEYNKKISGMHALAPVAFLSNVRSPFIKTMIFLFDFLSTATNFLNIDEFMPHTEFLVKSSKNVCQDKAITQDVCSNILFLVAGFNSEQLNKTMLPVILSHTPSGASTKQFLHFGQLLKNGNFQEYDYGFLMNQFRYGKLTPPKYILSNVNVPVALYYSANDWLVSVGNVEKLSNLLPNVIDKYFVPMPEFNHLDYLWAVDAKTLLYNRVIDNMKKY